VATPYTGLEEADLLAIRKNLRDILAGKKLASTSIQGASSSRRIDSLQDVRRELMLVNQALREIDPDLYGKPLVTRTYGQGI
jgi:hypothetical protein